MTRACQAGDLSPVRKEEHGCLETAKDDARTLLAMAARPQHLRCANQAGRPLPLRSPHQQLKAHGAHTVHHTPYDAHIIGPGLCYCTAQTPEPVNGAEPEGGPQHKNTRPLEGCMGSTGARVERAES